MYCLTRISIICCFLTISLCRPPSTSEQNENEEKETEYEGDGESAVDDEDSRLDREEPMEEQDDESGSPMTNFDNRPAKTNADDFSAYKFNKNIEDKYDYSMNSNDDYHSHSQRRQSNPYIENNDPNDQAESSQHFTVRDVNNYIPKRIQNGIRNKVNEKTNLIRPTLNYVGESLFESKLNGEQLRNVDKGEYNNDAADTKEPLRYFKEYYNTIQRDKQARQDEKKYENSHFHLNRDRRQTQDTIQKEGEYSLLGVKQNVEDKVNGDEESAIKRHIKKLSEDELEELFNSLSDDKRALLNKIMENDHTNLVNKREITKKAGALEDGGCEEAGISDLRKAESVSVTVHDIDTTENTKQPESQTEIAEISSAKNAEHSDSGDNKAESVNISEINSIEKTEVNLSDGNNANIKNQDNVELNLQVTSKNDNKREINLNDVPNTEVSSDGEKLLDNEFSGKDFDDSYFCNQDEEFSQLIEDEADTPNTDSNMNKREAFLENQKDNEFKSLEESFPNSNTYDESGQYSESNMMPLVRVKRKNEELVHKKRSAALLPDVKVAYFPYRAENDDEDNEEGSEFDDDGFYDRTSNIAHINEDSKPSGEDKSHLQSKYSTTDFVRNDNIKVDTMSIGSDTDSVLSGIEGVDDNLMYISGSRSRRALEGKSQENVMKLRRPLRSTPLIEDEMKSASENYINVPNYQESDAFGALPINYESDLSRFKRVRRVKPAPLNINPLAA